MVRVFIIFWCGFFGVENATKKVVTDPKMYNNTRNNINLLTFSQIRRKGYKWLPIAYLLGSYSRLCIQMTIFRFANSKCSEIYK